MKFDRNFKKIDRKFKQFSDMTVNLKNLPQTLEILWFDRNF
jgi:hypothetical protein